MCVGVTWIAKLWIHLHSQGHLMSTLQYLEENLRHYNPDGAILVTTPQECTNAFSRAGDKALAKSCDVPRLGSIPLDPSLMQSLEDGQAFIDLFPNSPALNAVNVITSNVLQMESNGDH